ncbi:MAG: hypothetical protein AAF092_11170 [Pseudomonadota bacterium]
MGRLLRFLIYVVIAAAIGLVAYAYIGPFLGADFTPPSTNVTVPVEVELE